MRSEQPFPANNPLVHQITQRNGYKEPLAHWERETDANGSRVSDSHSLPDTLDEASNALTEGAFLNIITDAFFGDLMA